MCARHRGAKPASNVSLNRACSLTPFPFLLTRSLHKHITPSSPQHVTSRSHTQALFFSLAALQLTGYNHSFFSIQHFLQIPSALCLLLFFLDGHSFSRCLSYLCFSLSLFAPSLYYAGSVVVKVSDFSRVWLLYQQLPSLTPYLAFPLLFLSLFLPEKSSPPLFTSIQ